MKFTQIPTDTFSTLQLNAGILATDFTPGTGSLTASNIIGATSGGINFHDTVDFKDFGEDIDNCPKNMMELKKIDTHTVTMSGTFVAIDSDAAKLLVGAGDYSSSDHKITPRNSLKTTDFDDIWWIGDYSNVNDDSGTGQTATTAGFVAIKLINALNTGGFQIQSTDKDKGKFAFEFTGHYSMSAPDTVPYELYIKAGTAPST